VWVWALRAVWCMGFWVVGLGSVWCWVVGVFLLLALFRCFLLYTACVFWGLSFLIKFDLSIAWSNDMLQIIFWSLKIYIVGQLQCQILFWLLVHLSS
jgi:hypothetical protein